MGVTSRSLKTEARISKEAWGRSMDASDLARAEVMSLRTTVLAQQSEIRELQSADRRRQTVITEMLAEDHKRQPGHDPRKCRSIQAKTMQEELKLAIGVMDKRIRHFADRRTERRRANANNDNNQKGTGSGQKPTCYECGVQGHFKRDMSNAYNTTRGNKLAMGMLQPGVCGRACGDKPRLNVSEGRSLYMTLLASVLFDTATRDTRLVAIISLHQTTQELHAKGCPVFWPTVNQSRRRKSKKKRLEGVPIVIIPVLPVKKESNAKPPIRPSLFSWVFFLATKDVTSGILKTFITEIENQLDHKVKVIRSDNGTEFKNSIMNQFCEMKEIKREFSVARTSHQNGVAERKNKTLIEATRTMLVDSKLPTTFWAKAVNTACYVLNMVLVIKPHNKIPYELICGRPPLIDFMKPFGCHVTILNTRDHLGKFDGKADEGYFVRYSVVSKAMRVFNKRTKIVEETLNIRFLENTPNVKGNGPDWLFDVDSLSIAMNYVPVATGNKTNGPKDSEGDARMKPTEVDENEASDKSGKHDQEARSESERLNQREMQTEHINSSNGINIVSTPVSTAGPSFDTVVSSTPVNTAGPFVSTANKYEEQRFERFYPFKNAFTLPPVLNISSMDNPGIFGNAYDDEDVEKEVDMNNVISSYTVPDTYFTKFHKDHPEDQVIGSLKTLVQTRHMTKINEEHGLISSVYKLKRTNHKDF
ncbi:putative ribonuclease H-like domain-containing protein [Tanacetum coccineum]